MTHLSLALKGKSAKALAVKDPDDCSIRPMKFFSTGSVNAHQPGQAANKRWIIFIKPWQIPYQVRIIFLSKAACIQQMLTYPKTEIGRSLKTIASLIFSDINTRVYYLSLGSFDTHVGQDNKQTRLFTEMNDSIEVFVKDLKANNRFEDVMIISFSEFGRRVTQNASNGTDHGTANNMFFISGGLKKPGLINAMPDLSDLRDGDLKHSVDFRNVYATLLKKWLGADDLEILGRRFQQFDFI